MLDQTPSPTLQRSYAAYATDLSQRDLTMSPEDLASESRHPMLILDDRASLYRWLAREMADELKLRNAEGLPTRWLLPVGPKDQYPLLAEICNRERISWKNVWAFHMDEWLDWQGREVPPTHPFSFRGYCQRHIYDLLDPELLPPAEQIVYPTIADIDGFSRTIAEVGGLDTTYAGFGYRGHVAFNEPPSTRWHKYTVDELAASKTRVVPLLQDTIVAHSHRTSGGFTQGIPPMALTVGMADILSARRLRLLTDGGAWKQYIVRVMALTTEPDVDLPVTLAHRHPNVDITVDRASALPIVTGLE
ncbi:hypothetical protein [Ruicaihuangia caeni]|uniref:Glucosamine-6-phosphate isomerase n=1 Tax=Ruicaihuangia caeni TaxID=3042517 RepID=A0AAW6TBS7_9MICO|nr:hypothetical protein [Klugiella sp. YN-L-19]MDI2098492.1 hypothetical protein [Klugiella sp. YN-L-19]